jgi:hypothetical protein
VPIELEFIDNPLVSRTLSRLGNTNSNSLRDLSAFSMATYYPTVSVSMSNSFEPKITGMT